MVVSDGLDETPERFQDETVTDKNLKVQQDLFDDSSVVQHVTQSGKYNLNTGQGNVYNIGDHYGPSDEEIRAIVRTLQTYQLASHGVPKAQSQSLHKDEVLEVSPIKLHLVEYVNSRLSVIEEIQKTKQLFSPQPLDEDIFRARLCPLETINQELERLASDVDQLLKDTLKSLESKLQELTTSVEESLREARSQVCLEQEIALLKQFQEELDDSKIVASWLNRQRAQNLAKTLGQHALATHPHIRETASRQQLKTFQLSINQFLERLSHCLIWNRTNSLDKPATPVVLGDELYISAFEYLKSLIPEFLPASGINQLQKSIDYLMQSLPNYRHR